MNSLKSFNLSFLQIVEAIGVLFSLIYVVLASLKKVWCWFFGIVGSIISIYIFIESKLYAESILFFYYVIAGFYGWYLWQRETNQEIFNVIRIQLKTHTIYITIGTAISFILALFLTKYTNALIPVADSFITIFSFIATWMTVKKIIENWIYWIIIDLASIFLYINRELYFYAILSVVYTAIAIIGYYQWNKNLPEQKLYKGEK
jgi:nicotinamide mononucleotide transporter